MIWFESMCLTAAATLFAVSMSLLALVTKSHKRGEYPPDWVYTFGIATARIPVAFVLAWAVFLIIRMGGAA